jgi:periplasmic divalent cation tolerance protein
MTEFIVVYVTVGSPDEGSRLAHALVDERLAACVNRISGVQSIYRWQGKVGQSEEDLLIIKTKRESFDRLKKRVQELHSYSVPEVIALPILEGSESYLKWLGEQLLRGEK